MKNQLLAFLIIAASSAALSAQNQPAAPQNPAPQDQPPPPPPSHRQGHDEFATLNLTQDQLTQLHAIRKDFRAQFEAVFPRQAGPNRTPPTPEQRTKLDALHEQMNAAIAKILTPEQLAQWKTQQAQHRRPPVAPVPQP